MQLASRCSLGVLHLDEISQLADDIQRRVHKRAENTPTRVASEVPTLLTGQRWPRNIRQLRTSSGASAAVSEYQVVELEGVLQCVQSPRRDPQRLECLPPPAEAHERAERAVILHVLSLAGGNRQRAAGLLGVSTPTLYRKLGLRAGRPPAWPSL